MSVNSSSSNVYSSFVTVSAFRDYDKDKNGLDKKEIAQGALSLKDGTSTDKRTASLLATVVAGGKNGAGFFEDIDTDRNGRLSVSEFDRLAGLDGNKNEFSSDDFKTLAPNKVQTEAVNISEQKLRDIADGKTVNNTPTDYSAPTDYNTPTNNYDPPSSQEPYKQPEGFQQQILSLFVNLLQTILKLFTQQGGSSYAGSANAGSTAGSSLAGSSLAGPA